MYCSKVEFQPTAALTFRVMPGSNLDITTYPFLPPTTMSGFLRRLGMLSAGLDLPETAANTKETPFYALSPELIVTGALPYGFIGTHKTRRKGPSNFTHTAFSEIYRSPPRNSKETTKRKKENIQLHTWEYFFCEKLVGYVLAESANELAFLETCVNWGCKLGKEGYAVVSEVSPPAKMQHIRCSALPSTLVHPDSLSMEDLYQPLEVFGLYRYQWEACKHPRPESSSASAIQGYVPISVACPSRSSRFTLDYLHDGKETFIALSWLEAVVGEPLK